MALSRARGRGDARRAQLDVCSGFKGGELKLRLRGVRERGLRIVHRVDLRGSALHVDVGGKLAVPDELRLGFGGEGGGPLQEQLQFEAAFDRLDLVLDL